LNSRKLPTHKTHHRSVVEIIEGERNRSKRSLKTKPAFPLATAKKLLSDQLSAFPES
jgi:hypothetical protein